MAKSPKNSPRKIIFPGGFLVSQAYLGITEETLDLLIEQDEEQWTKAKNFWKSVKAKEANKLSDAQLDWLERIEEACENY